MTELPKTMQALVLDAPDAALDLREIDMPRPGPGEVLVRVAASPINPSDLMTLKGEYGIGWSHPLVPGFEGSGTVVASGGGLMGRMLMGKPVACVAGDQGLWAEYAVVPAARCIALPKDVPLGAGAMSFVNPLTAIALIRIARQRGHWAAISTAAGGALGRMIRKRARIAGVKIIDVVRRAEQAEELRASGARHVLSTDSADFDAELKALCKQLRCRMAFDAVGGDITFRLAQALRSGSEILVYGALAHEAIRLHPGTMIFKGLKVEGFWLSTWLGRRSLPEQIWLTRQVTQALTGGGFAETRVARIVPLAEAAEAPAAYAEGMSAGKTLIAPGADDLGVTVPD